VANPVVHWEIGAKDGKEQREFYAGLFGWEIKIDQNADYGMVEPAGEGGIGGGIMQMQSGVPPYLSFYVAVDDLQRYLDKAASMGGRTVVGPTPIPGVGAFAMFADPEGNVVGLLKQG
jgi:predicted enzyme related to lactoylglutathione lyase